MMRWLLLSLSLFLATPALAVLPDEILDDPALEARARALSQELRCLVCRNENIDDSHADLARDLRLLVRERLVAGDTDQEALDYLVDRYGEYVLLNPRMSGANLLIWLAGPVLLLAGGAGALVFIRRNKGQTRNAPAQLSDAEKKRLAELTRE